MITVKTKKTVHYIIAVHGMGEQRKNETVLPIISHFAAARHNKSHHTNQLTLGLLASKSTYTNWIELDGIPSTQPNPELTGEWQPLITGNPKGDNFRFVDFVWSDVTREQHPQVGQSLKVWSDALINRLQARKNSGANGLGWIIYLLENLQNGLLLIEFVLNLKAQSVSNLIFNDFLGDVELYGDFPNTRGRAVRLFHEMMAKLHSDHIQEFDGNIDIDIDPQYTIIAHSLGTVMALDAIIYAHADINVRLGANHYPGYDGALFSHEHSLSENKKNKRSRGIDLDTPLPSVDWVDHLTSFVTLGSPIDKYLALWTENYKHFTNTGWLNQNFVPERTPKIRHFNYSDEQDPVGHELNILETTPVWQALMEKGEDIVFTRYAVPGLAHAKYWNDYDLFRRILDVAIDKRTNPLVQGKPQGQYCEWFKKSAFWTALGICYVAVPIIGWLIAKYFLESVIELGTILSFHFVALLGTLIFTHILMKLVIMWRLLLVVSRTKKSPMREKAERIKADNRFKFIMWGTPILWGSLLMATFFPCMQDWCFLITARVWLGLAFVIACDIAHIYFNTHNHWDKHYEPKAKDFNEYVGNKEKQLNEYVGDEEKQL